MRELIERLEGLTEARGSVQTGPFFLTYKKKGDRIDYTVWAHVLPYFGAIPAAGAIYIDNRGLTPDGLEELAARYDYGKRGHLMGFNGKPDHYPYTKEKFRGDKVADIKKMRGTTIKPPDTKEVKIVEYDWS